MIDLILKKGMFSCLTLSLIIQSCNNEKFATIETALITEVTKSTAVSGGKIVSEGGSSISVRGVCWGTEKNPEIIGNKTTDGSGTGIFTSRLDDLEPGTGYYVRAYATNSSGTSYGDEKSFNTIKSQIIADHTVIGDFRKIPPTYMDKVKKMMVCFWGESHSVGYKNGLVLLNELYPEFKCNIGTGESYTDQYLRIESSEWIGEEEWFTWNAYPSGSKPPQKDFVKNFIKSYANAGHPISVLGFAWCYDHTNGGSTGRKDPAYGVPWYGFSVGGPDGNTCWGLDAEDHSLTGNRVSMDTYLNTTVEYINYCKTNNYNTKIVFTTCPVDDLYTGAIGYQGHLKQEYIRSCVRADTSRILFDYADILCYDDDGKQTTTTWNGHVYPTITPTNLGDGGIGHISRAGAIRLAKAQWWLLARIAGWNGN